MKKIFDKRKRNGRNTYSKTAVYLVIAFLVTIIFPLAGLAADPADFSGTWELTAQGVNGHFTWILTQNGSEVTGLHQYNNATLGYISGTVSGNVLSGNVDWVDPFTGQPTKVEAFSVTLESEGSFYDTIRPDEGFHGTRTAGGSSQDGAADPPTPPTASDSTDVGATGGLIAHYKFDGDFKDSSGKGNDGTKSGNVTIAAGGAIGQCAEFKGGHLAVAAKPVLNLGKQYTISTWVVMDDAVKTENSISPIVIKQADDSGYTVYEAYIVGAHDAQLSVTTMVNNGTFGDGIGTGGVFSEQLSEKWTHLVFKGDGNKFYIYVDGKLTNQQDIYGEPSERMIASSSGPVKIGANLAGEFFNGKMDDLRLYNTALSEEEIVALYNLGGAYKNKIMLTIDKPMMQVDGRSMEIDPGRGTSPQIFNYRTMVPIRAIIETMGGAISWTAAEQRIDLTLKNNVVQMWIGRPTATVNGVAVTLQEPPMIWKERTLVPLRFVGESLGSKVEWDAPTQTITVLYNK